MKALAVLVTLGALCLGDGIPIAERVCASERPLPLSRPEIGLIESHNFSLKNPGKISFPDVMAAEDIIKLKIDPNPDDSRNSGLFIAQRRSPQHRSVIMLLASSYADAAHFTPIRAKLLFSGNTGSQRSDELDGWMPEKVSGGRLARIFCKNSDQCRFASPDDLRHKQDQSDLRNIDIGSDLSLADAPGFPNEGNRIAGLSDASAPSNDPQTNRGQGQNNREIGDNPIRVPEMLEYAGHKYNKEYVERGAFIVIGVIGSIIFGIYYAGRDRCSHPTHRLHNDKNDNGERDKQTRLGPRGH
jgi:hypothetical protein